MTSIFADDALSLCKRPGSGHRGNADPTFSLHLDFELSSQDDPVSITAPPCYARQFTRRPM